MHSLRFTRRCGHCSRRDHGAAQHHSWLFLCGTHAKRGFDTLLLLISFLSVYLLLLLLLLLLLYIIIYLLFLFAHCVISKVDTWHHDIILLQEIMEEWAELQRMWMYLEVRFSCFFLCL